MRIWILIALLMFGFGAHAKDMPKIGDPAPQALGRTAQGETLTVDALRGTVIVATFWASWCSPCRQEMTVLERMQQSIDPSELRVVAINFQEPVRDYRKIAKALGALKLTLTHDVTGSLSKPYGVKAIPFMVLIDHEGRIANIHQGVGTDGLGKLVDEINGLLEARERALIEQRAATTAARCSPYRRAQPCAAAYTSS